MKYRKRPVVIDAVKFTGANGDEIAAFMGCQNPYIENGCLMIGTLEGVMKANPGDWIIRGVKGEFYPCKPDIFEATYELIEEKPVTCGECRHMKIIDVKYSDGKRTVGMVCLENDESSMPVDNNFTCPHAELQYKTVRIDRKV